MTFEVKFIRWDESEQANPTGYAIFKIGIGSLVSFHKDEREMIDGYMFLDWGRDDYQIS